MNGGLYETDRFECFFPNRAPGNCLFRARAECADLDFTSVKIISRGTVVGSAQLVRNSHGITCVIHTSGLVPGDAYNVWWVIPDEMLIFNASGGIAGGDGTATFAGHASIGPVGPVDNSMVLMNGDGSFDQPRTDAVTVIIRHHGPPIPGVSTSGPAPSILVAERAAA